MKVKVDIRGILHDCLERAIRGFVLNDLCEIEDARNTNYEYFLEGCCEKLSNRFWCAVDDVIRFPDWYADD